MHSTSEYKKTRRQSILQWKSSDGRLSLWSFPHLRQRSSAGRICLSIPVLLSGSARKFITAQQFGGEGWREEKEEGVEVEKQKGQPCQPWDLPWLATATPPLGKSQLSLATSDLP